MQKTRQQILHILNHRGSATVQEIVEDLQAMRGDNITAVTVRHHLNLLLKQEFIISPEMRHRSKPGRPQHIYTLTEKAHQHFPNNYEQITSSLLSEIQRQLPSEQVNVILEGVAENIAMSAHIPDLSIGEKMNVVVNYLSAQGYDADWEKTNQGYILHTSNCPYHEIARNDDALCHMDMHLIASLVGKVPRRISHISCGDATCSYLIPE